MQLSVSARQYMLSAMMKHNSVIDSYLRSIRDTIRHPLVRDVKILTLSQYIATGLGFLTTIVAARILGPKDYGIAVLTIAYPDLLWSVVSIKSVTITTRYIAGFRATDQREALKAICKVGYALDLLTAILALIIISLTGWWLASSVYNLSEIFWLMIIYAASFPFVSLSGTSWAVLSSWEKFRLLAFLEVLRKGVTFIFVLIFLLLGFGVSGMIFGMTIGNITIGLTMVGTTTYFLLQEGIGVWWKAPLSNIKSFWRELTKFFGWNYIVITLSGLLTQIPLILLGKFRSPEDAGFYRLSMNLMTATSQLYNAATRVVYPRLSTWWAKGQHDFLRKKMKQWTLRGGIPLSLLVLLVILLLPFVVPVIFGKNFYPMVIGAQTLLLATAVSALFFWLNPYYYATGQVTIWTKGFAIYTVFVLTLGSFVIPKWGFFGMAVVFAIGKALFSIIMAKVALSQKFSKS